MRAAPSPAVDSLHVTGGSHGTTADLEALDALAAGLGRGAVAASGAGASVARVAASPELLLSAALDPRGAADVLGRLSRCVHDLTALGGGLAATAGAVTGAVGAYRAWDAQTAAAGEVLKAALGRAVLQGLVLPAAVPVGALVGAGWVGTSVAGELTQVWARSRGVTDAGAAALGDAVEEGLRDEASAAVAAAVAAAWDAVGPYQDEVADLGVHGVLSVVPSAPLAAGLAASGLYGQPTTAIARPEGAPRRGAEPVAGVGALVAGAGRLRVAASGIPAAVDVARTPGAPGEPGRVVVFLPATQAGVDGGGSNPADMDTNLLAVAGRSTAVTDGTIEAMRQAGVLPGDEVAFVGFSQGGLSAVQLAADPRVRAMSTPRAVVTAGSPTATQTPPGDVTVLSLEHDGDPVPALDGAQNPDLPGWTTVRAVPDGEPHDADSYARTGALVDASDDPSLVDTRAALEPFLAMDETTTVSRFRLVRTGLDLDASADPGTAGRPSRSSS